MTTEHTNTLITPLIERRRLLRQKDEVGMYMLRLAIEAEGPWDTTLVQVLSHHCKELSRRLKGLPLTAKEYEDLSVFNAMGLLLMGQLLDRYQSAKAHDTSLPAKERQSARFLAVALEDFSLSLDAVLSHYEKPYLSNLGQRFHSSFSFLPLEQAEKDAEEFRRMHAAIFADKTIAEVERQIAALVAARKANKE